MAQRYGGKHSPAGPGTHGPQRTRAGARANLLFIAPLPLVLAAFTSPPTGLALYLAAFGTMILAAWLTREGLAAEDAYNARKIARRPALPRKILGSLLTAAGLGLAGYAGGGTLTAVIYGVLGGALHFMAFGPDPLRDKGAEGLDMHQTDRVARAVDEAESHLAAMRAAIAPVPDRTLAARVEQFQRVARDLFRTVEEDPRDLTAARRYLGVYLLGARDATVKFAEIYTRSRDAKAREDYLALLDDLEQNFAARTRKMLVEDRTDLDIEIGVLRDRLQREGVAMER